MLTLRRLFIANAAIDFAALLAFLILSATDRTALEHWVSGGLYAGMVRSDGLDATVTYVLISTSVVHLIVTGLFVRLAVTIPRGRTITRVGAALLLVVSTLADAGLMASPVGGLLQRGVMAVSIVLKLTALVMLARVRHPAVRPARTSH